MGINLKVNLIAWLEFELGYYCVVVQHISHYTTGTPLMISVILLCTNMHLKRASMHTLTNSHSGMYVWVCKDVEVGFMFVNLSIFIVYTF